MIMMGKSIRQIWVKFAGLLDSKILVQRQSRRFDQEEDIHTVLSRSYEPSQLPKKVISTICFSLIHFHLFIFVAVNFEKCTEKGKI